jgi:hypothetical protein
MVNIRFQELKVGSIEKSSALLHGENIVIGWTHKSSVNEGFGRVGGSHNTLQKGRHLVVNTKPDEKK